MMRLFNSVFNKVMSKRFKHIEAFLEKPHQCQNQIFQELIKMGQHTAFGQDHGLKEGMSYHEYTKRVPITNYEQIFPYIERHLKGEEKVLWPTPIKWFAKSSGTTNGRSKYIPVSKESLYNCHYKAGKDALAVHLVNRPDSNLFEGKYLTVGGSLEENKWNHHTQYGDVSAIITNNLPYWAEFMRTPPLEVALMSDWERKIDQMSKICSQQNVVSLAGVPTWTMVLLERILEVTGKDHLLQVWPHLECFAHGAVSFSPYRETFKKLIPDEAFSYIEIYNASEGFFGLQLKENVPNEMTLLLDYGIFYEFIPLEEVGTESPNAVTIEDVKIGKNYAMVISTNAGLWRYVIGDTIKFTSKAPYYFTISGRTKHFINAFGEEVIIENAEEALVAACRATDSRIKDYTAGPVYLDLGNKGSHEWVIEFDQPPNDLQAFTEVLDRKLREINSDYDAKRSYDLALILPKVHAVPQGTFYDWLKRNGKIGGQHKVPRLSNNRQYLDDILVKGNVQT